MALIRIEGVPGFSGDFPMDFDTLDARDHHVIKVIAGVTGNQIVEALDNGDHDVVMAFAVCALYRAGIVISPGTFWESPLGSAKLGTITMVGDTEAADAGPPAQTPLEQPSGPSGKQTSTGPSSNGFAENPATVPSRTGLLL